MHITKYSKGSYLESECIDVGETAQGEQFSVHFDAQESVLAFIFDQATYTVSISQIVDVVLLADHLENG